MTVKLRLLTALLVACGCLMLALPSGAAPPRPTEKSAEEAQADDINNIITAYQLAEFGRKYKSPEALMTAAGLFRKASLVKLGEIKEKPTTEAEKDAPKGDLVPEGTPESPNFEQEANNLFKDATDLAKELKLSGAEAMIKLARERGYQEEGTRGAAGGPKHIARTIGGHQTQVFHIPFVVGQHATVGFHGTTPMKVTVVRAGTDNVVAAGVIANGQHGWMPTGKTGASAAFTIRVQNLGQKAAKYTLFTN